jgi:hypothetical protein
MDYLQIIRSQYLATLEMLKEAIEKCPDPMWDDSTDKNRFWHVAYHALFYTHLYLQPTEQDFKPWAKHRKAHDLSKPADPYSKEEVLLPAASDRASAAVESRCGVGLLLAAAEQSRAANLHHPSRAATCRRIDGTVGIARGN